MRPRSSGLLIFTEEAKNKNIQDGPIKEIDIARVSKEPPPMYDGFEWVTLNLEDEGEVCLLLYDQLRLLIDL
jgi:hypothetical protein